jgi:hypothetical protein
VNFKCLIIRNLMLTIKNAFSKFHVLLETSKVPDETIFSDINCILDQFILFSWYVSYTFFWKICIVHFIVFPTSCVEVTVIEKAFAQSSMSLIIFELAYIFVAMQILIAQKPSKTMFTAVCLTIIAHHLFYLTIVKVTIFVLNLLEFLFFFWTHHFIFTFCCVIRAEIWEYWFFSEFSKSSSF